MPARDEGQLRKRKTAKDQSGHGWRRREEREKKKEETYTEPSARNKTNTDGGEKLRDVHLTFLSQKKRLSENSSSMRTHELHAGGGRGSQGYAAVGRSWHSAHPSHSLWCLFVLLSLKKKNENFIVPANQRGGSPPAWDPLNSSSFFPAALESTDLILIIYGRHFLLPYLCCVHVPHRFRTSPALYKGLSIGSPPTDLSTLPRPVLSSVLQPALVTSQSRWVRQQRVLERKEKKKGVFLSKFYGSLLKVQETLRYHWKAPLKGVLSVSTHVADGLGEAQLQQRS